MATEHEIKSEKILVKDIFSTKWFRIPEYQRPYIWSKDEVNDLLDDLSFACVNKPNQEYFLGSFVYQNKKAGSEHGQEYEENDLLDGQQRMTTLLMLFACIRDLSDNEDIERSCRESIFQKGNKIRRIPERTRIVYAIREEVQDFVETYVIPDGGTSKTEEIEELTWSKKDPSVPNMAGAILEMRKVLTSPEQVVDLEDFITFLYNQVLLIYVSTEDLDDAFRLFTILNDRGVPLRNSDILKSQNLGALEKKSDKARYAKLWEEAEGELGDDFDRFLNHIRTILVKDKARLNLLDEFEQKIYNPREKDKSTGIVKPALLVKGKQTFELVENYLDIYSTLNSGKNFDHFNGRFAFDNLVSVMMTGLPSTDWIPPLMRYFERYRYERLYEFLINLDNKFSADWIGQLSPTKRIENMNKLIGLIEKSACADEVIACNLFEFDAYWFLKSVETAVYGRRFTRYLLLKLDYLFSDDSHPMTINQLSVEHILPQNPEEGSQWRADFTDDQRKEWTDKLGNLVLISMRKNTSQGRKDYSEKRKGYFQKRISSCPNSLRVLNANVRWTPVELQANHQFVIEKVRQHYKIQE
ncbi:DUF262 domain-containing protein [Cerasicoccus arenae]|uniref:DUF262 domain-containing protein n=1 Tax=Cerasicoccus arenae TaxID=424488 RepID=A0A8J3DEP6_9BACT|nr:DUF262 domain-containing protein [Cerasicoccus arenae]MBK1857770.1 DUF262 domain-containing protein [Cerasicoccus arenae]GHC11955.1 hypothetical protein GCM10007047_31660 [Cerasicoccus arenae]